MKIPYAGGPVVERAALHTTFWGAGWKDPRDEARIEQINQFHQDLFRSPFLNVLTQYGIPGVGSGRIVDTVLLRDVPRVLTSEDYLEIIRSLIFPRIAPSAQDGESLVLMIYLDENTIINDPTTGRQLNFSAAFATGYHEHLLTPDGLPVYYGFVSHSRDLGETTTTASHEFAEILTDPEYNAWTPDAGNTEIGDLCDGQDTITVGDNPCVVQTIWSNLHDRCICQVPYPLPELQPGPGSAPAAAQLAQAYAATLRRGVLQPGPGAAPAAAQMARSYAARRLGWVRRRP